jgi:hypothetical protein
MTAAEVEGLEEEDCVTVADTLPLAVTLRL